MMTDCEVGARDAAAWCQTHEQQFFFCLRERLREVNEQAAANQERYITTLSGLQKAVEKFLYDTSFTPPWESAANEWTAHVKRLHKAWLDSGAKDKVAP